MLDSMQQQKVNLQKANVINPLLSDVVDQERIKQMRLTTQKGIQNEQ